MAFERMRVFTGNANPRLAEAVCHHLNISLGRCVVGKFSDGEVMVELLENVRGRDVFILQSTSVPTNDNLMEIMVMVDALKRSSAGRITACVPYFGYARQDRRPRSARVPITAKVVADMLTTVGVQRVMVMDLHADQIQGFFNIPVDNIYATPILLGDLWKQNYEELLVVSPDVGGVVRARAIAKRLDSDLAGTHLTAAQHSKVVEAMGTGQAKGLLKTLDPQSAAQVGSSMKDAFVHALSGALTLSCAVAFIGAALALTLVESKHRLGVRERHAVEPAVAEQVAA